MNLNRLQRFGIIISILWAIGAGYYERNAEMTVGRDFLNTSFETCMKMQTSTVNECLSEMSKNSDVWMKPNWGNISFIAFAPILLGWLLIWLSIRVYRWVKAGQT
jgi:hypothetical protein